MKKTMQLMCLILIFFLITYSFGIDASALTWEEISAFDKIELPQNINFSVSPTCSGHSYFIQATAREDGFFAVYSRHVDAKGTSENTFKRVYIDLYNAEGEFIQEISFMTPFEFAIELTEKTVNMYFYDSVLTYDLQSKELYNYLLPTDSEKSSVLYATLREKEFICGNWQYRCIKSFDGYTKLIRSNDTQEQVLVEMPGSSKNFWNTFFPGMILGVSLIAINQYKKKNRKNRNNQTEDGSMP